MHCVLGSNTVNNKKKGNRKELLVKGQYESAGWVVVKSGASLSPFDLICFKFDENWNLVKVHVLQIKTGKAKTLKYNVKREEEEYKKYKSNDLVEFRFVKLHKWERYHI